MVDWLSPALAHSGTVITANRRLARSLVDEFNTAQQRAGRSGWRSPSIYSWQDWCHRQLALTQEQNRLPTRINAQQSQWLWERCLRREVADQSTSYGNLVRLARDAWQSLADWQVPIKSVAAAAHSADQRMFAAAAGRYLGILEREHWVDDAGTSALLLNLIEAGNVAIVGTCTFAGFDRQRPITVSIQAAISVSGGKVEIAPLAGRCGELSLQSFDSTDSELRAAGAWVRSKIDADVSCRVAIIANDLVSSADNIARLVREGFTPGWQYGDTALHDALNVSYGRKLAEYPVVSIAISILRWLARDLSGTDIGMLLRSPLLSSTELGGRSRLELRLRQLPDRQWSPAMISAALQGKDECDSDDASAWLAVVAKLSKRRREIPVSAAPAEWALFIDETLRQMEWPGRGTQGSFDFQLINRWRELLNELARLDLVSAQMPFSVALSRLESLAYETVFQPESTGARVQLLGPLEAAGAEFDALWIAGVSSANWPPNGAPTALVSRRLQESCRMPDSTPAYTTHYARDLLHRLINSAREVRCSFARLQDDSEQSASSLLLELRPQFDESSLDPGWHASAMLGRDLLQEATDAVPCVTSTEKLSGGAAVIQQQLSDPISAFIRGRLSARPLYPQVVGISPPMRGNLIHDALYQLYTGHPQRSEIAGWLGDNLDLRIAAAVDSAFARHERQLDAVLHQMFKLERRRVSDLLRRFVEIDGAREEFEVTHVESTFEFEADNIRLELRFDRVDRLDNGQVAILDYKTGAPKRLWGKDKEASEIQLFVYSMATEADVGALALVNIDSREVAFVGAGRGFTDGETWADDLRRIQQKITSACVDLQAGDVRINKDQGAKSARSFSLLSRFSELREDDG